MHTDYLIIGGGIAGASIGYRLAGHGSVIIAEMESQAGYHTTGRSAAFYAASYGGKSIRPLTVHSKSFLMTPPDGFSDVALMHDRGALYIYGKNEQAKADAKYKAMKADVPDVYKIGVEEIKEIQPFLNFDDVAGAIIDTGSVDLDVSAIHQGYLKGFSSQGGKIVTDCEILSATFSDGLWQVQTSQGLITAKTIINSAGAWSDVAAVRFGAKPIGVQPLRRTVITIPAYDQYDAAAPLTLSLKEDIYFKPESGGYLVCPCNEDISSPCDAQPEDLDVALAVDRFEKFTGAKVSKINSKWAGLRTFAPDRSPVIGYDEQVPNFFWSVGQGGYGIQTSPAWSEVAVSLILGRGMPPHINVDEKLYSPKRFKD